MPHTGGPPSALPGPLPLSPLVPVPRLPTCPPPSPGSACGRSHSCAPPSPLSSRACGRSHGCSPPLPLSVRPIVPPAEWLSGQPHELLSGSRGFDFLPPSCTANTQHRKYSIGSCTTRNCNLACLYYLPTYQCIRVYCIIASTICPCSASGRPHGCTPLLPPLNTVILS